MKQLTRHLEKNGLLCLNCSDRGEFVKALFSEWFRLGRKVGSTYELTAPNTENVIAAIFPQEVNMELFWAHIGVHQPFQDCWKRTISVLVPSITRIKQKHG
jgi:hypothetical protein